MVVDRFEHRLAPAQVDEVLSEDVEVVAVGMQRSEPQLGTAAAVEAVIVVG